MNNDCINPINIDKIQEGMTGQQVSELLYSNFDKLNKGKADKKIEQDIDDLKQDQIDIYNDTAKNKFIAEAYYLMSKIKLNDTVDYVLNNAPSVYVNSVRVVKGVSPSVTDSDDSRNVKLDFVLPDKTTVTVGSTSTLEPGYNASVFNTGTENDAVFEFSIPRGEKGDKGDQGNSGVSGDTSDIVVVNNLNGGESEEGSIKVLAAEQGKILNDKVNTTVFLGDENPIAVPEAIKTTADYANKALLDWDGEDIRNIKNKSIEVDSKNGKFYKNTIKVTPGETIAETKLLSNVAKNSSVRFKIKSDAINYIILKYIKSGESVSSDIFAIDNFIDEYTYMGTLQENADYLGIYIPPESILKEGDVTVEITTNYLVNLTNQIDINYIENKQDIDNNKADINKNYNIIVGNNWEKTGAKISGNAFGGSDLININLPKGTIINCSLTTELSNATEYNTWNIRVNDGTKHYYPKWYGSGEISTIVLEEDIYNIGYWYTTNIIDEEQVNKSIFKVFNKSLYDKTDKTLSEVLKLSEYGYSIYDFDKVLFISNNGDDTGDGTIDKPFKTISKAISIINQEKKNLILLQCGSIFYESIYANNCVITYYGEGKKPQLCGYFKEKTNKFIPKIYDDVENLWEITFSDLEGYQAKNEFLNIGHIFDNKNGKLYGCKCRFISTDNFGKDNDTIIRDEDISKYDVEKSDDYAYSTAYKEMKDTSTYNNMITINKCIEPYGTFYLRYGYLHNNFDFFQNSYYLNQELHTGEIIEDLSNKFNSLVLKCDHDPNNDDLLFAAGAYGIRGNHLFVKGIDIYGFGIHGVAGQYNSVVDCEIHNYGGAQQLTYNSWVKYGNGIELWAANNNIIKNNYIYLGYEEAITIQSVSTTAKCINTEISHNTIEKCSFGCSAWMVNEYTNSTFSYNVIKNIDNTDYFGAYRNQRQLHNLVIMFNNTHSKNKFIPAHNNVFVGNFISTDIPLIDNSNKLVDSMQNSFFNNKVFVSNGDYLVWDNYGSEKEYYRILIEDEKSFKEKVNLYRTITNDYSTEIIFVYKDIKQII